MTKLMRDEARLAILEAEILYLCADLGGDALARAIDLLDGMRIEQAMAAQAEIVDVAAALGVFARGLALSDS